MERRIVLGDRHQALLKQIIDVCPGDVESDELRALFDTSRGRVSAGGLAPNLGFAATAVEQQLINDQVGLRRLRIPADPSTETRGYHNPSA